MPSWRGKFHQNDSILMANMLRIGHTIRKFGEKKQEQKSVKLFFIPPLSWVGIKSCAGIDRSIANEENLLIFGAIWKCKGGKLVRGCVSRSQAS